MDGSCTLVLANDRPKDSPSLRTCGPRGRLLVSEVSKIHVFLCIDVYRRVFPPVISVLHRNGQCMDYLSSPQSVYSLEELL